MKNQVEGPDGKGLKRLVRDSLEAYGAPFNLGEEYTGHSPIVLCLLLDSHWYPMKRID